MGEFTRLYRRIHMVGLFVQLVQKGGYSPPHYRAALICIPIWPSDHLRGCPHFKATEYHPRRFGHQRAQLGYVGVQLL